MRKPIRAVLDSYALISLLFEEEGSEDVKRLLERAADRGVKHYISAVNWAEVRNVVERASSPTLAWPEVRERLLRLPLEIVPVDRDLAEQAGLLKSRGGVSLADCFGAALAKREKAPLCTGDPEFKRLESDIRVEWI
jgi:predicted nucleic acid-binding protein